MKTARQQDLFRSHAGRPRGTRVSHAARPRFARRAPVHVTLRVRNTVWNLRSGRSFRRIRSAFEKARGRFGMRLIHFSVQGNHLHLIVEAVDQYALTRGMQGLMVRIARAINRASRRRGKVFADHYFARELQTPAEVRRAVRYVLDNNMLHARATPQTDPCASRAPVATPRTWLLTIGWIRSRAGPLPVSAWATF